MAWEDPVKCVGSLLANADLSAKQFYCVKVTTVNNKVVLCTTAGEVFDGVLQNKPASGEAADIMTVGITKVSCDEALTAGDLWGTSADGQAQKIEASATGADIRSYFGGRVIEGAAAGELATVSIGMVTGQVAA